jgi:hypothetical protein
MWPLGLGAKGQVLPMATRSLTVTQSEVHEVNMDGYSYFSPMGENMFRLLVGMSEGKRSLGRPRCGCVDDIKKDLFGIEWGGVDWIDLAQYS